MEPLIFELVLEQGRIWTGGQCRRWREGGHSRHRQQLRQRPWGGGEESRAVVHVWVLT